MTYIKSTIINLVLLLACAVSVLFAEEPTSGIQVGAPLLPTGDFPSHVADKGYGGWHTTTNVLEIPEYYLRKGMAAYDTDDDIAYVYDGFEWIVLLSDELTQLNSDIETAYILADSILSNTIVTSFTAADSNLQTQITSNDDELIITDTRITAISNSVYGLSVWSDLIDSNWTATVDSAAQISHEHPREIWFRYNESIQYVNVDDQLVLKVRDDGGIVDGYTAGAAFVLPSSYFSEGAGDYYLLFKIEEYENESSRLAVKISEANEGSGDLLNYYTVRTQLADVNYGQPLNVSSAGDAIASTLIEKVFNSIDQPGGAFYKLDFTYNGTDDVVVQFGAASIDNNSARSVIINDIVIPQNDLTHILRTDNPHVVTKAHLVLENVDNTSDMDKPVSTAQGQANSELESAYLLADSDIVTAYELDDYTLSIDYIFADSNLQSQITSNYSELESQISSNLFQVGFDGALIPIGDHASVPWTINLNGSITPNN